MARHKKSAQKTIVTRIAKIGNPQLNKWKFDELNLIAKSCGILRSDIWNEYGSLKAWGVSQYAIDKVIDLLVKSLGVFNQKNQTIEKKKVLKEISLEL